MLLLFVVKSIVNLTLFPHKTTHFSAWMAIDALTMSDVVFELALVDLSVCPYEFSPSVFQIIVVLAFENVAIAAFPGAFALSFAFEELADISASIFPLVVALTMEMTVLELSCVGIAIY